MANRWELGMAPWIQTVQDCREANVRVMRMAFDLSVNGNSIRPSVSQDRPRAVVFSFSNRIDCSAVCLFDICLRDT